MREALDWARFGRVAALLAILAAGSTTPAWAAEEPPELTYGGPFELVNQDGEAVTDKDFLGRYVLLTFGYTHCPDVCPTGLYTMATSVKRLGEDADRVVPAFVSVDPKRDTPERLREYVKHFHPRMVGLTGDKQAVFNAAKAYRVFYFSGEIDGKYVVDHTANFYLMGPDGDFLEILPYGTTVEQMTEAVKKHL